MSQNNKKNTSKNKLMIKKNINLKIRSKLILIKPLEIFLRSLQYKQNKWHNYKNNIYKEQNKKKKKQQKKKKNKLKK